jgi:hypothetical protein
MINRKQISVRALLGIVLLASLSFAILYSRWPHSIAVSPATLYSPGDIVDVFMMPPKETNIDGGWHMDRLCSNALVTKIFESEGRVEFSVSAIDKWNLLTCDRDVMLTENSLDENRIWVD